MKNIWLAKANGPVNSDGTVGPMCFDVMGVCACGVGIRSWFHGQGMRCGECKYTRGGRNCVPNIDEVFSNRSSRVYRK